MEPGPLTEELNAACAAVTLASKLCKTAQASLTKHEKQDKKDASPVTVADYAAQAVVAWSLLRAFPDTQLQLVAEEESKSLHDPESAALLERITELFNATVNNGAGAPPASAREVTQLIDAGRSRGGREGRHWVLDPIDGTRGFLANRQYAVCLALLEEGAPVLGVLGCPNLPLEGPITAAALEADAWPDHERGCLIYAARGRGAYCARLFGPDPAPRRVRCRAGDDRATAAYMTSVEAAHNQQGLTDALARAAGITAPALKLDSQVKYGLLARGDAAAFLRIPRGGYREKIWDHAAGALIVEEAGGAVSDLAGQPLDFGLGAHLDGVRGGGIVAAAPRALQATVVEAAAALEKGCG